MKALFRTSTLGFSTEKVKVKIEISLHTVIQCWFFDEKSKIKIENRSNTSIHHWFYFEKSKS